MSLGIHFMESVLTFKYFQERLRQGPNNLIRSLPPVSAIPRLPVLGRSVLGTAMYYRCIVHNKWRVALQLWDFLEESGISGPVTEGILVLFGQGSGELKSSKFPSTPSPAHFACLFPTYTKSPAFSLPKTGSYTTFIIAK